jgi:hypothetical protein
MLTSLTKVPKMNRDQFNATVLLYNMYNPDRCDAHGDEVSYTRNMWNFPIGKKLEMCP